MNVRNSAFTAFTVLVCFLLAGIVAGTHKPRISAQQDASATPDDREGAVFRGQTAGAGAPRQGDPKGALYDLVVERLPMDESSLVTWDFGEGGIPSYTVDYTNAEPRAAGSGRPIEVEGDFYLRVDFFPARRALFTGGEAIVTYDGPLRIEMPDNPNVHEIVFVGDFEAYMTWYIGMQYMAGFEVETLESPPATKLRIFDPVPGISSRPVLGVGSTGPEVLALEQMLRQRGVLEREEDTASFGETLRRAVTEFQREHGIVPNGRVGPETWARLSQPGVMREGGVTVPGLSSQGQPPPTPTMTPTPTATNAPTPTPTPTVPPAGTIYLTFDDGPNAAYTPHVLSLLADYGASATFFILGEHVDQHPSIARDIVEGGHTVGNHTYHHTDLTEAGLERFFNEVRSTQEEIATATGVRTDCLRPPYGATSPTVRDRAAELGLETVLWDVDPQDWRRPGASVIANHVVNNAYDGAVVLLHDGGGNRTQTVDALDSILAELTADGYDFRSLNC